MVGHTWDSALLCCPEPRSHHPPILQTPCVAWCSAKKHIHFDLVLTAWWEVGAGHVT